MIARAVLALALAGCGRVAFDARGGGGVDGDGGPGDGGSDAGTTGSPGPRWVTGFGPAPGRLFYVAGTNGEVVAASAFQTSLAVDGGTFTGKSPFGSVAVGRYTADGVLSSTSVLDATGYCDIRALTMHGDDALVAGYTTGGTTDPTFGACSVATSRQDPIAVRVDRTGAQFLAAHWKASGVNAQAWGAATLDDGTIAMAGVYGSGLTIGTPLPATTADPTVFVTRFADGSTAPVWAYGFAGTSMTYAGPLAAAGNDLCAVGAFGGPATVFGAALPYAGGDDDYVARVDAAGTPRFVRAIGTAADESVFGEGAVAPSPDGGCYVSLASGADLTIDGVSLPVAGGPSVVVHFDGTGTAVGGARLPSTPQLAVAGGRPVGALQIAQPTTLGGISFTPDGIDVAVIDLDAGGTPHVAAVIGRPGDQELNSFAAIADDAVAVGVASTGGFVFGDTHSDSGAEKVALIAVLGL